MVFEIICHGISGCSGVHGLNQGPLSTNHVLWKIFGLTRSKTIFFFKNMTVSRSMRQDLGENFSWSKNWPGHFFKPVLNRLLQSTLRSYRKHTCLTFHNLSFWNSTFNWVFYVLMIAQFAEFIFIGSPSPNAAKGGHSGESKKTALWFYWLVNKSPIYWFQFVPVYSILIEL